MPPVSSPDHPERQARRALIHGVYAITADEGDTTRLLADVEAALSGGIRILQYRNKLAGSALKRQQLEALKGVCEQHRALLIVNDDWRLAAELGIDAVHLGEDDGDIEEARRALGPGSLIGVSCYASVERARALAPVADYLAFGALFASGTKPLARPAPLSLFREVQALSLAPSSARCSGRGMCGPPRSGWWPLQPVPDHQGFSGSTSSTRPSFRSTSTVASLSSPFSGR